jgi:hypothetical protein
MIEATAQKKYACPACGAEAQWNPGKQALVCAYCGTVSPAVMEVSASGEQVIKEHDLATALRSIPDESRGWQAQRVSVLCQSCQAISVFDPSRIGQRCDFCGSTALIPYESIKEVIRPESLLPMKQTENQVRDGLRQWLGARWFAPNKLKQLATTDTVKGLYIPYWTFDAQVHADWTADSGYHYYVTESYQDANGKRQTRQVQKTRWVPSSGSIDHFFDDELVPASRGIEESLLRGIEPFPTKELTPYNSGFLSGWVVERYQIDLIGAAQRSRAQMDAKTQSLCASKVPGDTYRNLNVRSYYSGQTFKHILTPVWLLTYRYGQKLFQVAINGYDGRICGRYPKSWIKITLAILAAAAAIGIIVAVSR